MDLGFLEAVHEWLWYMFSPFWTSMSPPYKDLVSEGWIYNLLVLALPILNIKKLGVVGECPLMFLEEEGL